MALSISSSSSSFSAPRTCQFLSDHTYICSESALTMSSSLHTEEETDSLTSLSDERRGAIIHKKKKKRRLSALEKTLALALLMAVVIIAILISMLVRSKLKSGQKSDSSLPANLTDLELSRSDLHGYYLGDPDVDRINDRLANAMLYNKEKIDADFRRRFPRDNYRSTGSIRRVTHNLPKPLTLVSSEQKAFSEEEKIAELLYSIDDDSDGAADPWELHGWMVWVQNIVYRHTLEDQWAAIGRNETVRTINWSEYQSMIFPYGMRTDQDKRRREKDRRRWKLADVDGDEVLTKHEYKYFIFPQLSPDSGMVLVPEAHADLDTDLDGRVSLGEFLAVYEQDNPNDPEVIRRETTYFQETLDWDQNGYLDVEEIAEWVEPAGMVQAKSEVVYVMQLLDANRDKLLTYDELLSNPGPFLSSQATFFGQIYKLKDLREEVFHINRLRRRR